MDLHEAQARRAEREAAVKAALAAEELTVLALVNVQDALVATGHFTQEEVDLEDDTYLLIAELVRRVRAERAWWKG